MKISASDKANKKIAFIDVPGCYSLLPHSPEEEIASEYICNGNADITLIVCDATALERNLNFVYQTLEAVNNVIVCVNLRVVFACSIKRATQSVTCCIGAVSLCYNKRYNVAYYQV